MSTLGNSLYKNYIDLVPENYTHVEKQTVDAFMFDELAEAILNDFLSKQGVSSIAYPEVQECTVDTVMESPRLNNDSLGLNESFVNKAEGKIIAQLTGIHLAALLCDLEKLRTVFEEDESDIEGNHFDGAMILLDPEAILTVLNVSKGGACASCFIKAFCHEKALQEIKRILASRLRLPYTGDENKLEL